MTSRNLQAPTKYKFLLLTTNTHLQGNRVISHRKGTKHYFLEGWGGGWAFWGMKFFSPLQVVHEFFWWSRAPWLVENSCSIFFSSWFPFHNFLKQFLLCRNIFFLEIANSSSFKKNNGLSLSNIHYEHSVWWQQDTKHAATTCKTGN